MAIWRAQVEWTATTNVPEDKVVNTFHFEGSPTATDLANIDDMLVDFYTETYAGGTIAANLAGDLLTGVYWVKIFCLDDPKPRLPRAEFEHLATVGTGDGLPAEVALCMSYQAAQVSGEPQARRRGRIYLGPFNEATNTDSRPIVGLITQINASASALLAAANASVTWQWVVYSRMNDAGAPVVGGWVDDEWDTQRRRGRERTGRFVWS